MSKAIVQNVYLKRNPTTGKVMISCSPIDEPGWSATYVSNYPATQEQLKRDFKEEQNEKEG